MSDLLSIGLSGVSAYRAAMTATSDNVANAETPGYARRSVRLREAVVPSSGGVGLGNGIRFSGVRASGVDRAWDDFQAAEARLSASAAGRATTRQDWLEKIEGALGHGDSSVGPLIGKFFDAGVALAANPRDRLGRAAMLAALDDATTAIRNAAEALGNVATGIGAEAQLEVEGLNADLATLAEINLSIRAAEPGRSSFASLQDERDRIIDRIAEKIDVSVSLADDGTATLTLARATGVTLLDMRSRAVAILVPAADGRLALNLSTNGTVVPLPASGGTLAGLIDVAASTADRRADLEAIATDFVDTVNTWSAAGRDLAGNPGGPLLAMAAGALTIKLATTDPADIAAASATAENGNLLDIPSMRGSDGAEARWAALVAGSAQSLASARSEAAAASSRRDNSFAARDEISGIDLDREAAELMRFQQAYNASTRIIQVARETLQSILDLF